MIAVVLALGCSSSAVPFDTAAPLDTGGPQADAVCPIVGQWVPIGAYCGGFSSVSVDGWEVRIGDARGDCELAIRTPTCLETVALGGAEPGAWVWPESSTDGGCSGGPRELATLTADLAADGSAIRVDADGLGWFDGCPYHAALALSPR